MGVGGWESPVGGWGGATSQKDTSAVPVAPTGLLLLRLRDLQVDEGHGLLVADALLKVELHQRQHLCQGGDRGGGGALNPKEPTKQAERLEATDRRTRPSR